MGVRLGWCIGYPMRGGNLHSAKVILDAERGDKIDSDCLESFYREYVGRFALVLLTERQQTLHLDPCGSLATVYSEREPLVASTPSVLGTGYGWNEEALKALALRDWIPTSLTSRDGIRRLQPNHYLDLGTWQVRRHWPVENQMRQHENTREIVQPIARALEQVIGAVTSNHPSYLALTAGRDSRTLLACSRKSLEAITAYTVKGINAIDDYVVAQLVRRYSLKHQFLPIRTATEAQMQTWTFATGHAVGGNIRRIHPSFEVLDGTWPAFDGMAAEVGRSYYWKARDTPDTHIDSRELLARAGLPPMPSLMQDLDRWLQEIQGFNSFAVLDLFYLEHRLGCWAAPQQYGRAREQIAVTPFNQRSVIANVMKLPYEYRMQQHLTTDLVARNWPELLELPFNQYPGVRGVLNAGTTRTYKAIRRFGRPVKRLLQRVQ